MLEELWAAKAFEHTEIYFNLLLSTNPRSLKLTPFDDTIYRVFREEFPTFRIELIDENELKSDLAKMRWRNFIEKFNKLEDYSFGTLLRLDSSKEFTPENSIFVVRIQFLAIEIARNREGFNDNLKKQFLKKYASMNNNNNETIES
jgi:Polysaccharide biosynthesis